MNEQRNLDRMAGRFVRFAAQEACDSSPLYERLSHAIADDPEILALAAHARPGQPVPNLLIRGRLPLPLLHAQPVAARGPRASRSS